MKRISPEQARGAGRKRGRAGILLAALLGGLGGCIENPGPDPLLGRPKPQSTWNNALFRSKPMLEFRLTRDSGRTSLRVSNVGEESMDSATFHLELFWDRASYYWFNPPYPVRGHKEFSGTVGPIHPGGSLDLSVVDSSASGDLQGAWIYPSILRMYQNGESVGNPFAGWYRGNYTLRAASGHSVQGTLYGLVNGDGDMRLGLLNPGETRLLANMTGLIAGNGSLDTTAFLQNFDSTRSFTAFDNSSVFKPLGKGYSGTFSLPSGFWLDEKDSVRFDSLEIFLDPRM